jgi:alpha-tubulin suppressor-like RCC1 family protein
LKKKIKILMLLTLVVSSTIFINNEPIKAIATQEKVSAGSNHSLALKRDGTVWSWGNNINGRLGINNTIHQNVPTQVLGLNGIGFLTDVIDITAGVDHSMALKSDGTVWGWGSNNVGSLGDNTTTDRLTPIQVLSLTNIIKIDAGWDYTLALKADGTVWSWGMGTSGELGDGSSTQSLVPIQVVGPGGIGYLQNVIDISANSTHSMALINNGTVYTWGDDTSGLLGTGVAPLDSFVPVKVVNETNTGDLINIKRVTGGATHSTVLSNDDFFYAWGKNNYGQFGDGTYSNRNKPIKLTSITDIKGVSGGENYTTIVKNDGTVWAFGYNGQGELGDGTFIGKNIPTQVVNEDNTGFLTNISQISSADIHNIALGNDGSVYTWGDGINGMLGNGMNSGLFNKPIKIDNFNLINGIAEVGVTIDQGQFKITNTTNQIFFENYTLGLQEVAINLTTPMTISIEDFTGTWNGWNLTIKIEELKNGTEPLIEPILSINCLNSVVYDTNELGIKIPGSNLIENEFQCQNGNILFDTTYKLITASPVMETTEKHIFEFPKEIFELQFSNKTKNGSYTGNITFELTSGP